MNIAAILESIRPGTRWNLDGNDYEGLEWLDDSPKPTRKTLEDAWPQVEQELKWRDVREERAIRLADCDWTQVADAPVDAQAWADYRQALRDIPQDFASPDDVVWPEQP